MSGWAATCASCGEENPTTARRCQVCGAPLSESHSPPTRAPLEEPQTQASRSPAQPADDRRGPGARNVPAPRPVSTREVSPAPGPSSSSAPATPALAPNRRRDSHRDRVIAVVVLVVGLAAGGAGWLAGGMGSDGSSDGIGQTGSATLGEPDQSSSDGAGSDPTQAGDGEVASPSSGDDPLRLGWRMVNQRCNGQFLIILASSGSPRDYRPTLLPALRASQDGRYLVTTSSCRSFNQTIDGNPIYAAYMGPYPTMDDACRARDSVSVGEAYVRALDPGKESRELCSCLQPPGALPMLSHANSADPPARRQFVVTDAQALLYRAGVNPEQLIGGHFGTITRGFVRAFQREQRLVQNGVVGAETWASLSAYC